MEVPTRAYVASFGFKGADQQKPDWRAVRRRAQPSEPGPDPQAGRQPAAARRAHQRPGRRDAWNPSKTALLEFPGCAVVISATTVWFLDRVATHILAWEGDRREPGQLVLVRRQLPGLPGEQGDTPRRGCGPPAPPAQEACARLRYAGISATTRFIRRKPSLRGGFPHNCPMAARPASHKIPQSPTATHRQRSSNVAAMRRITHRLPSKQSRYISLPELLTPTG